MSEWEKRSWKNVGMQENSALSLSFVDIEYKMVL